MQINIQGQNVDLTHGLQDYVHNKLLSLEDVYDRINQVDVVLKVEGRIHIAEGTVHVNQEKLMSVYRGSDSKLLFQNRSKRNLLARELIIKPPALKPSQRVENEKSWT